MSSADFVVAESTFWGPAAVTIVGKYYFADEPRRVLVAYKHITCVQDWSGEAKAGFQSAVTVKLAGGHDVVVYSNTCGDFAAQLSRKVNAGHDG